VCGDEKEKRDAYRAKDPARVGEATVAPRAAANEIGALAGRARLSSRDGKLCMLDVRAAERRGKKETEARGTGQTLGGDGLG
jgi:hypothetical protein